MNYAELTFGVNMPALHGAAMPVTEPSPFTIAIMEVT